MQPIVDQLAVVVPPGVEARRQVFQHRFRQVPGQAAAPEPGMERAAPGAQAEQLPIVAQVMQGLHETVVGKHGAGVQVPRHPAPVAATGRHVSIEGHALVLGFLDRMPVPQGLHVRLGAGQPVGVAQHAVGQHRRVVFQRAGDRQAVQHSQLIDTGEAFLEFFFARVGQAMVFEPLVVLRMQVAVGRFLADEILDLGAQYRVRQAILGHVAHCVDE